MYIFNMKMDSITNTDIDNTLNLLKKGEYGVVMDRLLEYAKNDNAELVHQRLTDYGDFTKISWFYYVDGWIYRQMGDRESALKSYEKCYELSPSKESLTEIFDCYFWTERYEEALPIAEKIVKEYGDSHKMLVIKTKIKLLPPKDALELIDKSLQDPMIINMKFAESPLAERAASICCDLGEFDKALAYIKRALSAPYPSKTAYELKEQIESQI